MFFADLSLSLLLSQIGPRDLLHIIVAQIVVAQNYLLNVKSKQNKTKQNRIFNWAIWSLFSLWKNAFLRVHNRAAITFLKLMIIWPVSVCVWVGGCVLCTSMWVCILCFQNRFLFGFCWQFIPLESRCTLSWKTMSAQSKCGVFNPNWIVYFVDQ